MTLSLVAFGGLLGAPALVRFTMDYIGRPRDRRVSSPATVDDTAAVTVDR